MRTAMKIQASRSRMSDVHVRESEIPAYFCWDDHSEYEVFRISDSHALRRYHGPLFGRALGDWRSEEFQCVS